MLESSRAQFAELDHSFGMAMVSVLLGEALPPGVLADIGLPLVRAAWRLTLARSRRECRAGPGSDGRAVTALPVLASASFPGHLTPREVEVLVFLARRSTNREIADALVLSVRTVERHISKFTPRRVSLADTRRAPTLSAITWTTCFPRRRGWLSPSKMGSSPRTRRRGGRRTLGTICSAPEDANSRAS